MNIKMKAFLFTAGLISFTILGCNGFTPGEPDSTPSSSVPLINEPTSSPRTPIPHQRLNPIYVSDNISLSQIATTQKDGEIIFQTEQPIDLNKLIYLKGWGIAVPKTVTQIPLSAPVVFGHPNEFTTLYKVAISANTLYFYTPGPASIEFFTNDGLVTLDFTIKP